ncbi:hypothetical protein PTSG_05812 [Salpingoeca rosetta]|uniref:Uncharacterized protein n=1 Tax=Salpingoeca rosetta (strain ATCC 50818 / BSB-021) TaxID=946362 RepID=F2UCV3_SALR5|nr:uncharacterized protein PTSG_05812 [Salpingoeca rosetta]EGD74448.1 hypothetical protein PTSG_05812 [Salpingoeca rosetta]|eukprot:XP_004992705.1 hypothetical protein PTSG_05812 [Salpingoeca rosetta]
MGCPVMGSSPKSKELGDALKKFAALLPQCEDEEVQLHTCRNRVASASSFTQKLWGFGIGRGHCAEEASRFSDCAAKKEAVSVHITKACAGGDHRGIAVAYDKCLAANENNATACAPVLQGFLDCARQEAQRYQKRVNVTAAATKSQ